MPIYRLGLTFLAIGLMGLLMVACPSKTVTPPPPTGNDAPQNNAPTDISLSKATILENAAANTVVGTLSTTDADADDTHVYSLVAGGSDFNISGNNLRSSKAFDFEAKSSFALKLKTDDGNGGTFEKDFTITVTNTNDAPTDITLSRTNITEFVDVDVSVGRITTTDFDSDSHTYGLVSGGSDFTIRNDSLYTAKTFKFEDKSSYAITIQSDDGEGGIFQKDFTIEIYAFVTAALIPSIPENSPANTHVGAIFSHDDRFTYTLISGDFKIVDGSIYTTKPFDYETKTSQDFKIKQIHPTRSAYEGNYTIDISDVNDSPPTDITLSRTSIPEDIAYASVVGTLSTTDPDTEDSHTYRLVSGHSHFSLLYSTLKTANNFDFRN